MNIEIENNSSIDLEMGSSKGIDYEIGKNKNTTSYNPLTDKPSINGVELKGKLKTEDLKLIYEMLINLPKINGVELKGDLSTDDLGIQAGGSDINLKTEFDLYAEYEEKDVYNAIAVNQLMEIFGFEIMQIMEFIENHEERISALEG